MRNLTQSESESGFTRLIKQEKNTNISTTEGKLVNELKVIKVSKILNLDVTTCVFEKSISDYSVGSFSFSADECSLDTKHLGGCLTLKNNKIVGLSAGLEESVKVEAGDDISQLFACQATADVNIKKLFMYRTVDCLILDGQQVSYWARLTLKGNKVQIADIDIEKRFELDSEDQIEELERCKGEGSMAFMSLHYQ